MPSIRKVDTAERVFIYDGSLSTPGCYESVVWIVYANHPYVSEKQVFLLHDLLNKIFLKKFTLQITLVESKPSF